METREVKEEVSGNGKGTLVEVMAQLVKDAENVIEDIGEEVRQELADEIAIIKDRFEKKKNQIMAVILNFQMTCLLKMNQLM